MTPATEGDPSGEVGYLDGIPSTGSAIFGTNQQTLTDSVGNPIESGVYAVGNRIYFPTPGSYSLTFASQASSGAYVHGAGINYGVNGYRCHSEHSSEADGYTESNIAINTELSNAYQEFVTTGGTLVSGTATVFADVLESIDAWSTLIAWLLSFVGLKAAAGRTITSESTDYIPR
jgi:hypothetical protein